MKHFPHKILIFFFLILSACGEEQREPLANQELWYTYPARYWNSQALHLGNGYFGASFFGGPEEEVFALSEASMWTGGPAKGDWEAAGVNPRALETLPAIRQAVVKGKSQLADSLIEKNFFGGFERYGNFTSVGELKIRFREHEGKAENYKRSLDLANSLGSVTYTLAGVFYERSYFCSYPDRILGMKFFADKPGSISFDLGTDIIQDSSRVSIAGNIYQLNGFIDGNDRPFCIRIHINNKGGVVGAEKNYLSVRDADEVEVLLTIATNYKMEYPDYTGGSPDLITEQIIQKVVDQDFERLKDRHIRDYRSLYDRISFDLEGNEAIEAFPTNERFERLKAGDPDPGYKELAFNLGRYMIISSSRPNTLPANIQGVWNAFRVAPWAGNYQSNVNIQEIYWSCGPTGLIECQQPYIDWIEDMAISGKEIAKRVYGTNGWISHTVGNIWGHAAPVGSHPWGMYSMGSAWHCQHVWDHYAFNQDKTYLEEQGYPLLKEASVFWLENLIPYEGYLITAPTVSAEHGALMTDDGLNPAFHDLRSDKYHYSLPGVYQDMEMLWDLFTNTAEAAVIMDENDFADSLLKTRERLLPLKTGSGGQLQEWYWDIDDPDCHHRHIAHLYAVSPGRQIHPVIDPVFAEAAKKSLNWRGDGRFIEQELASGGNWARAHRMWCWTRLMDGNRANKIMTGMLTEQGFENGLTYQHDGYHWERPDFFMDGDLFCHFQLDGSAALPGCIVEMLVQSHLREIHLFPALPDEFKTGSMRGIRARGGYVIDLEWKEMKMTKAVIYIKPGSPIPGIRLGDALVNINEVPEITIIEGSYPGPG